MTYEKAIDYVLGGGILRNPSKDRELRTMIIEALERRIPKEPNWVYGKHCGVAKCSVCGEDVHHYMNGCPECLNVIDWSNLE